MFSGKDGMLMISLFLQCLEHFFSSWLCIFASLTFICGMYTRFLYLEYDGRFRVNVASPFVKCLCCGRLHIYYNTLSCMAGAFRKKHRTFINAVLILLSIAATASITGLLAEHRVFFGILSVLLLVVLSVFFVVFHFCCTGSMCDAAFFLVTDMVSSVSLDTEAAILMFYCGDSMVASIPIKIEDGFQPKKESLNILMGFSRLSRKYGLLFSGDELFNGEGSDEV